MLNKIIAFSLRNRLLILIVSILLLGVGIWTALRMEVDVFPDLNAPTVVVMTEAQGMAAEEVERLVTFPIETAVNGASDVRRVRSNSTTGFSVVWVEFDWGTDIYRARQIVSEKLSAVAGELPPEVGQSTLGPQSSILGEVLFIGLTSDTTSLGELRTLADWTIRPQLLATGGVAQVSVIGGDVSEYQIRIHPERMRHYGVTLNEVLSATREMNRNASGGVHYEYGNEYIVRGILSTSNVEVLGKAVVKLSEAGLPIVLADVADVELGVKTPKTGVASVNTKPAVLLTVTKQPATGTVELTQSLEKTMEALSQTLPADVEVHMNLYRQQDFIDVSISNIQKALFEGALFVVVILFVFLMNARTTLISLVTIPLSLLVTILVLYAFGLTVNTMSIGGMAIAIGSLVDDAIVDVENVYKRLRENHRLPAARRRNVRDVIFSASREVRMPILNSTLIIVVSFFPLFFLSGLEGRMLVPLGISFIVALFASTLVALTLTPVLCSFFLLFRNAKKRHEPAWVRSMHVVYIRLLKRAKRPLPRKIIFSGTALLVVVTVILFFSLGRSFLPSFNEGSFTINLSALPGISLAESDSLGRRAEKILLEVPEVEAVARKTGRAELDEHAQGVHGSELEVPISLRNRSREEVSADIRSRLRALPGVNVEIGQPITHRIDAMLSGTQAAIAIKVFGPELSTLRALGSEIREAVENVEGVVDLNVEQQVERPQLLVKPRRVLLARLGITLPEFADYVSTAIGGAPVSRVQVGSQNLDLTVRMAEEDVRDMEHLRYLMINTADGRLVPLSDVADLVSTTGPNAVSRENAQRKLVVSANVEGRDVRSVVNEMHEKIQARVSIPKGYRIEFGGQFESEASASRTLLLLSVVSIAVILLLLYLQFRSFRQATVVLLNLPLALIGGVLALVFTDGVLSIPAVIGFISLFGMATRGGMLLVDRYNELVRRGFSPQAAVLQGSLDRLLPILMTALCSALALLPLALGGDLPGNEIQSPMAKVMLGGLLTSTLLNLLIVPLIAPVRRRRASTRGETSALGKNKNFHPMNHKFAFFLVPLIACAPLSSFAQVELRSGVPIALLDSIEQNNSTLRALSLAAQADKHLNRSESHLPDPEAELQYGFASPDPSANRTIVSLTQEIDWGILSGRKHKWVKAGDELADQSYNLVRLRILSEAEKQIVELIHLNRLCEELSNRAAWASSLLQATERQFEEGAVTQIERNKVKLTATLAAADLQRTETLRSEALGRLQALNGGIPLSCDQTIYEPASLPDREQFMERILENHPKLLAAKASVSLGEEALSLAQLANLPNLRLGFVGEYAHSDNFSGFTLGFTLPLWGNNRRHVQSERALLATRRMELHDLRTQLTTRIFQAYNQAADLLNAAQNLRSELAQCRNDLLLKRMLDEGEISLSDFLLEVSFSFSAQTSLLEAERDARLALVDLRTPDF